MTGGNTFDQAAGAAGFRSRASGSFPGMRAGAALCGAAGGAGFWYDAGSILPAMSSRHTFGLAAFGANLRHDAGGIFINMTAGIRLVFTIRIGVVCVIVVTSNRYKQQDNTQKQDGQAFHSGSLSVKTRIETIII